MRYKIHHKIAIIAFSINIACFAYLFFLYFIDGEYVRVPIEKGGVVIQTEKNEYHIGELVRGYFTYCKPRDMKATITWNLINGYLLQYPSKVSNFPSGCHEKMLVDIEKIPMEIVGSDHFRLEVTAEYKINPLRTITYKFHTNNFTVKGLEQVVPLDDVKNTKN
jgi:hypothetical protein